MEKLISIKVKILSASIVVMVLLLGTSILGVVNINSSNKALEEVVQYDYELVSKATALSENVASRVILARGYVLYGDEEYKEQFLKETEEALKLEEQISASIGNTPEYKDAYEKTIKWRKLITDQVIPAYENGGFDEAIPIMEEFCQVWAMDAIDSWHIIKMKAEDDLKEQSEEIISQGKAQQQIFISIAVASILLGVIVSYIIASVMVRRINKIVERLTVMANNDFSLEPMKVKGKDELSVLSTAVNKVSASLKEVVSSLTETESSIYSTSNHLVSNSKRLSSEALEVSRLVDKVFQDSYQQLEGSKESASAMENVAGGIQTIAESSLTVAERANHVSRDAIDGNNKIQDTILQMNTIHSSVGRTASLIEELGNQSSEIEKMTVMINSIAEQTNLLALNAAIEAARAGDQGKGFAVVANEVRNLAEQSKSFSHEISQVVQEIQRGTRQAIESTSQSLKDVQSGLEVVHVAGNTFERIGEAVLEITEQFQAVSSASEEISATTEEVSASVAELSIISNDNVLSAKEVQKSSENQLESMKEVERSIDELNTVGQKLRETMNKFQI